MDTILPVILMLVFAALIAALPLLQLRQVRTSLKGALGSLCFATGCLAFFALCSGFFGSLGAPSAFAADSGTKEAATDAATRATGDPSPATSAEAKGTPDES